MCAPNAEYQFVNPTTQVALYSICLDNCQSLLHVEWQVYEGMMNASTAIVQWKCFNTTTQVDYLFGTCSCFLDHLHLLCIAGQRTSNFTATSSLFLRHPNIDFWRFQVTYTFASIKTSSAIHFQVNQPPSNGTCSITPRNGTVNTLFTIVCSDWTDEDGIKDYAFYGKDLHLSRETMLR
jgi:hypothetical protein